MSGAAGSLIIGVVINIVVIGYVYSQRSYYKEEPVTGEEPLEQPPQAEP
jgi:hypothetical protein